MKLSLKSKLSVIIPALPTLNLEENSNSKKECTHIIDEIYLSGYQFSLDLEFLKKNKFTHIINCAADSNRYKPYYYEDFKYLVLDFKDEPTVLIDNYVKSVVKFIEQANEHKERKILIHCFEGVSRAPTLLISYLMLKFQMSRDAAVKFVKEKRECVEINLGFMCQLEGLQITMEDYLTNKIWMSC